MSRKVIRIFVAVAFTATITACLQAQTQTVHKNEMRPTQVSETNSSTTDVHHYLDPRLRALEIGPTNGLLIFYKSRRPLTLIDPAAADSVTNGITLKQLVENLGPGWRSPDEGIGLIYWNFKDGRELHVLRPRFYETAAKTYTLRQMFWLTNWPTEILKTNDPAPEPRYVRF